MNIDKSFQLLTADSGKLATEDAKGQSSAEASAEFGELFDAELESQEQQDADSRKQNGQEIAASQSDKLLTSESLTLQSILLSPSEQTESLAKGHNVDGMTAEIVQKTTDSLQGQLTLQNPQSAADGVEAQGDAISADAKLISKSDPWLQIINQSNDFKEILSQSSSAVISDDVVVSSTETLLSKVLGVPMADQEAGDSAKMQKDSVLAGTADTANISEGSVVSKELATNVESEATPEKVNSTHPDSLQKVSAQVLDKTVNNDAVSQSEVAHQRRVVNSKFEKLPAEKVNLQELEKVDRPHATSPLNDLKPSAVSDVIAAGETPSLQLTQPQTQEATTASNSPHQKSSPSGVAAVSTVDSLINDNIDTAEAAAFDDAVRFSSDLKSGQLIPPGMAAKLTTTQVKNGPQSFAQFQKAVNVAAAAAQKQQLMAEQTQSRPQIDVAIQLQKTAELHLSSPVNHAETSLLLPVSPQTERLSATSSGHSGSFSGQQQQPSAAQIFATKLNDAGGHIEQAPLNLLEPNAASQLKERVMFQVNQKIQSAEIKLAPEELGNLQVKVQLQQDQLSVQFVVQQQGAKEALEQQLPRLKDMLAEQGIELTQGQVSQQREGSDAQRQARERNQFFAPGAETGDEPLLQQAIVRVSDRMVDYYA
jgi:flagellar hook-length control protein FliK